MIAYHGGKAEWWVADYAQRRGSAPTLVAGPYRTKLEAEVATRNLAKEKRK